MNSDKCESIVDEKKLQSILCHHYGKEVQSWTRLSGFEDDNYLVITSNTHAEVIQGRSETDKFVVKVLKHASKEYIDIQTEMMLHLCGNEISTCLPISSLDGKYAIPYHHDGGITYHVMLLSYLSGSPLSGVDFPLDWLKKVGALLGNIDKQLMKFRPDNLRVVPTMCSWELRRLPELECLLHRYCEPEDKHLGHEIIEEYNRNIVPVLENLNKGYIHGDLYECNIIVLNHAPGDPLPVSPRFGVIDFGDACVSLYASDLAISVAFAMVNHGERFHFTEVAKHLVSGYIQHVSLNDTERRSLRLLICARLLQVYVLVGQTNEIYPESNTSVVNRPAWIHMCREVWACENEEFMSCVGL